MSSETVQKGFGTKAALAKAVYDVTLVGDDEPVPLRDRPEFVAIVAEPTRSGSWGATRRSAGALWERLGPLIDVLMQGAQAGEPDLVAFVATIRRESYAGASGLVDGPRGARRAAPRPVGRAGARRAVAAHPARDVPPARRRARVVAGRRAGLVHPHGDGALLGS